jgi:hypothetical protein
VPHRERQRSQPYASVIRPRQVAHPVALAVRLSFMVITPASISARLSVFRGRTAKSSLSLLPEAASQRRAPEVGIHHKVAPHRKRRVDRQNLLEFAPAVATAAAFPVLWVISRRIRRHARSRQNARQPMLGQRSSFPPLLQAIPMPSQPSRDSSPKPSSLLERQLRITILDHGARERLVAHAMKKTGCGREAAIRRVLDDLYRDNACW